MKNKEETRGNYKQKRKLRQIAQMVGVVLLAILIGTMSFFAVDLFKREPNPDNLIQVETYDLYSQDHPKGPCFEVNEKTGVITVKGEAKANGLVQVATVTIPAGTYTFSGLKDPDVTEFCMYLSLSDGQDAIYAGMKDATFTVTSEVVGTVYLRWGTEFDSGILNRKVYPTLVAGTEAGSFWAE